MTREEAIKQITEYIYDGEDNAISVEAGEMAISALSVPEREKETTEIEDVVKVVRCKDCIYSDHWYGDHQLCTLWSEGGIGVFDDGFCNYGKESED